MEAQFPATALVLVGGHISEGSAPAFPTQCWDFMKHTSFLRHQQYYYVHEIRRPSQSVERVRYPWERIRQVLKALAFWPEQPGCCNPPCPGPQAFNSIGATAGPLSALDILARTAWMLTSRTKS